MTDNVIAFTGSSTRRPIRQATSVRAGVEETFEVFVGRLAQWWPLDPFSYGGSGRVAQVSVERRVGGRLVEHWHDGTTHEWGTLLEWRPPHGFTMTWNITGRPTEVELRFHPEESDVTTVVVEHRGWDELTEAELKAACALPGGYDGGAFDTGWARILTSFATMIDSQRKDP